MRDSDNKGFWQKTAPLYSRFMKKNEETFDKICAQIDPYLQPEFRVLELACGTGQITFRLYDRVERWIATDFSDNMLKQAEKRGTAPALTFRQEDATALSFTDGSFDAVVISNCLHIMPKPGSALGEIRRVLKPDGFLFAPTFVYEPGYSKSRIGLLERIGFRTYYKWTAEEFVQFVEKGGFLTKAAPVIPGSPAAECVYIGKRG